MKMLRRTVVVLLAAASLVAFPAGATSFSTDQSDLYYIVAESGWGIQLVQRGSVIFATMFVYGPSGAPTWYVATMNSTDGSSWTGDLYATTGPYFGTLPFNPANVVATKVGTMTWTAQTTNTGNVSYTVNGVAIGKNVVRQTLVLDDFSGIFVGLTHQVVSGCLTQSLNATSDAVLVTVITQAGQTLSIEYSYQGLSSNTEVDCTGSATLSQSGQMGSAQGSLSCSDGSMATLSFTEMQVTTSAISSKFEFDYSSPAGCRATGWLGGGRSTMPFTP